MAHKNVIMSHPLSITQITLITCIDKNHCLFTEGQMNSCKFDSPQPIDFHMHVYGACMAIVLLSPNTGDILLA